MGSGELAIQPAAERPEFKNPAPGLTPEEFIQKIIELRPLIRAQQERADELGGYVPEVHEKLLSFGGYRPLQPRRYGGHEYDIPTFLKAAIEMARSDPGSGWCYTFGAGHVLMLASHFNEKAQDEIFGLFNGLALAPLRAPTTGTAKKVDGGYIINGAWDYASGIPYATHVMPTARVVEEGSDAPVDFIIPVIPKGKYKVHADTWGGDLTLGLRASGSHTFSVDNVFVPDHMVTPVYPTQRAGEDPTGTPGVKLHGNTMYLGLNTSFFGSTIASVMVGAAWAAIDEFDVVLRTKRTVGPPFQERYKSHDYQRVFGEAMLLARAAETILLDVGRSLMAAYKRWGDGVLYSAREDFMLGGMASEAARLASEAVEMIFYAGGSSGAMRGQRLNRYYRDMATYRTHPIAQYGATAEAIAQAHFDLPLPLLEAVGGNRSRRTA
ncbi:MAG: hypothetical protein P4L73_13910 [Caulobacteraceae bacterium]|nr:hypothetical protein [Caulobacteraceae bacterium]